MKNLLTRLFNVTFTIYATLALLELWGAIDDSKPPLWASVLMLFLFILNNYEFEE